MGFNEMTHAYIAAKYYEAFVRCFGERGKEAFIHGTQYHALSRGRRMAQRAIRDGQELTYSTYLRYGEWTGTGEWAPEEEKVKQMCNPAGRVSCSPFCVYSITCCPWHDQFSKMDMLEAGEVYCENLDNSISRGFNPNIQYQVCQTMYRRGTCVQTIYPSDVQPDGIYEKKLENMKNFEYHCACSYWAYYRTAAAIFGEEGKKVGEMVLADFTRDYGQEMTLMLKSYENTDFNFI